MSCPNCSGVTMGFVPTDIQVVLATGSDFAQTATRDDGTDWPATAELKLVLDGTDFPAVLAGAVATWAINHPDHAAIPDGAEAKVVYRVTATGFDQILGIGRVVRRG